MKSIVNFLIKTNKLKEMPRTGWVLMGVKNPETVADHTFRLAFLTCILAKKKNLNIKKAIKIALIHDLCEVYAGDVTTLLYHPQLAKEQNDKKRKKIEMKWARLSQGEKEKIGEIKFKKEKSALLRLINFLKPDLKREIFSLWLNYEKGISKEGKLVKELNSIETLLQSVEYFGTKEEVGGTTWWESTEEVAEDRLLLKFLQIVQNKFYRKKFSKDKELENILDFVVEIGKLKRMPRLYWVLRGVKNPETVAGHIFTVALMVLVFGREKKHLNIEKLFKMALCHEITAVHTHDTTPYGDDLPKNKEQTKEFLEKLPITPQKEKIRKFLKDYKAEERAVSRLVSRLQPDFKKEIIQLWQEYRNRGSLEARFLAQLNALAILLQSLLYKKKEKRFSVNALWEWVFEICDDPICFSIMEEMKKRS